MALLVARTWSLCPVSRDRSCTSEVFPLPAPPTWSGQTNSHLLKHWYFSGLLTQKKNITKLWNSEGINQINTDLLIKSTTTTWEVLTQTFLVNNGIVKERKSINFSITQNIGFLTFQMLHKIISFLNIYEFIVLYYAVLWCSSSSSQQSSWLTPVAPGSDGVGTGAVCPAP